MLQFLSLFKKYLFKFFFKVLKFLVCLSVSGVLFIVAVFCFFFNYYLAAPRPTLGHSQGDSLINPMLITVFVHIWPEGHRELPNDVGSLSLAERLAGFEPGTFRFLLQHLNPLGHSPPGLVPPFKNAPSPFWLSPPKFWKLSPSFFPPCRMKIPKGV